MSKKKAAKKAKVKTYGPDMYERNQHGLLSNVDYEFNDDGSVNWRAMIKPEFLYPNKDWFTLRNKEIPSSSEGLRDNQLLIMLAGIKELANLRGFKSVTFETQSPSDGYVVAKCKVVWISNYESFDSDHDISGVVYEDVANATLDNTDSFASKFLETIACNRAFVRCVRNFLNVHIVGADEIDKSKGNNNRTVSSSPNTGSNASPMTPIGLLQKTLDQKHAISEFEDFLEKLRELWKNKVYTCESIKDWKSWKDVPTREARKLTSILSK